VHVHGAFLEPSSEGLVHTVELLVSEKGSLATTLRQSKDKTRFGFAAGSRLRLYIKDSDSIPEGDRR
jgi:hypothetical protein